MFKKLYCHVSYIILELVNIMWYYVTQVESVFIISN